MPLPDTLATVNAMVEPTNEVNMLEAIFPGNSRQWDAHKHFLQQSS